MVWKVYNAESYWDFYKVEKWLYSIAEHFSGWLSLEEVGKSRQGKSLYLLRIGKQDEDFSHRPALWLDAGTHASEWTGVSAVLYTVSQWLELIEEGEQDWLDWLSEQSVLIMPCISPDGYQAMFEGSPYIRSSLRPPKDGAVRIGLEPRDLDGDGKVRWMRWRDPAGPYVEDPDEPLFMRPRTLDDRPEDAFFFCSEGDFLQWDGFQWTQAPRKYGLDLNRNFPGSWKPFSMYGMDGGAFPGSEPESRAVLESFSAYPTIAAGLSFHTYTGCILTQPYRENTPLKEPDIRLMEKLAKDSVAGTGYKVYRVFPDFMYDQKKPTVGVWSDTMTTTFGTPGYTVEFWDPFGDAGLEVKDPIAFFRDPDADWCKALLSHWRSEYASSLMDWTEFEHPQLGTIEIGGIDYLRTIRNPPESKLAAECKKGFQIVERFRKALPKLQVSLRVSPCGADVQRLEVHFENQGFLSTSGLQHADDIGVSPRFSVSLECGSSIELLEGTRQQELSHLEGWGVLSVGVAKNSIYPSLSTSGNRSHVCFLLKGSGSCTVKWFGGRAGRGEIKAFLS